AFRCALVGRAEDHDHEESREDDLNKEASEQGIAAWGMIAKAVAGEVAGNPAGFALGDFVEHAAGKDAAQNLRRDVGDQLARRKTFGDHEPDRYRGVQVAARDMPDRKRHRKYGESEGESNSKEADAQIRVSRRDDRRPATGEDEPERAE